MTRITLLTDFGTADGYVGAMKGVLTSRAPQARIIDISHGIGRGDVGQAARTLKRFASAFPEGTLHLVVVDPGVGTSRRGMALEADGQRFVAPDNGVLTPFLAPDGHMRAGSEWRAVDLSRVLGGETPASRTFHGRDLFAPAAALLATGSDLIDLGDPLSDPVLLEGSAPRPIPGSEGGGWEGQIVTIDRFGNLMTDIPGADVEPGGEAEVGAHRLRVRDTYGDVRSGELLALVNSDGCLELAVRDGSAFERLECERGATVRYRPPRPEAGETED